MHGIITGHPLIDGNKRTGYALARLVLQDAGLDVRATMEETYTMVIQVGTGKLEVEGITHWMEGRIVPLG